MLKWRVITAAALAPPFLLAIWLLPTWMIALLFALIVALGAAEWARLSGYGGRGTAAYVAGLLLLLMLAGAYLAAGLPLLLPLLLGAIWWVFGVAWLWRFSRGGLGAPGSGLACAAGYLLLVPAWLALVVLHGAVDGAFWITFLLLLVWGADVGAYFAGRAFGRRKLAPSISPNKTWEGVLGGAVLAVLLGALAYMVVEPHGPALIVLVPLALVTVAISVVGDLFESMIKRLFGVKDSGTLLPGHGGVLDRVDSLTAAGPVFALGMVLWQLAT
jgi:phosphatidate cytidylyltransferase